MNKNKILKGSIEAQTMYWHLFAFAGKLCPEFYRDFKITHNDNDEAMRLELGFDLLVWADVSDNTYEIGVMTSFLPRPAYIVVASDLKTDEALAFLRKGVGSRLFPTERKYTKLSMIPAVQEIICEFLMAQKQ